MSAKNRSKELYITRIFDAPVQTVWEAWTDPKRVAIWWGPRGFTLTTHSKDLRAGGTWKYTMHGPDGVDYPNITQYLEVEPYAKLVYDHGANEHQGPLFRVTVRFSEVSGKTRMEMSMALPTPEAAEEARRFIKKAGGNSTWDRLAEYLEKESSGKETFVIARSFEASLERLFEMWTHPEHLARWLPPVGAEMWFRHAEIRAGGTTSFVMTGAHGALYGRTEYLQIEAPHRIVYLQQFCDEHGNLSRHPGAPIWPDTILTTVVLAAENPERTRVTVTSEAYGAARADELRAFAEARGGMTQGWTGSFDKLEALLEPSS